VVTFRFPAECCRCNARLADQRLHLSGSTIPSPGTVRTWMIDVPICRECHDEIRGPHRKLSRAALFLLPLPAALWTYVCPRMDEPANGEILPVLLAFVALGFSAAVILFFFIGLWLQQAQVSRTVSPNGRGGFRFGNAAYQARFDELNAP
jgi:hypothetical protein